MPGRSEDHHRGWLVSPVPALPASLAAGRMLADQEVIKQALAVARRAPEDRHTSGPVQLVQQNLQVNIQPQQQQPQPQLQCMNILRFCFARTTKKYFFSSLHKILISRAGVKNF
jgi:hypothetical protein